MVTFEEIKSGLSTDEGILWKKQNYTNELKELKFTLNISILTICISIFSISFYFLTSTIYNNILISLLISMTVLLISGFPLYLFFRVYSEYKKIILKLGLKLKNLTNYEEFYILTKKRWIQKSFNLAKTDDFKLENYQIVKKDDMALLNLDNIEIIYISPKKKGKGRQVNFFRTWDKYSEDSVFHVSLEEEDYQNLMQTLREAFLLSKEEQNVIHEGDIAFYCKIAPVKN